MSKIIVGILVSLLLIPSLFAADEDGRANAIEKRQRAEIMSFFLKDASSAKFPTSALGIEAYNKAVKYYQESEFDLARQMLGESLAQDDANPLAYELLGDIEYHFQRLGEAKANYQIAYSFMPADRIKEKLEKLDKEYTVEKNLKTYQEKNFVLKYQDKEQNYEGFELRELLRKTYREISKDFAYYFKSKIVVILYDESDFKKIVNMPHWVAGVYDGKVRMPINKVGFGEDDLRAIVRHEVTHAFVAAISKLRAPVWINEGLAEFEENKEKPADLLVFNAAVKTKTLFTLDQLMSQGAVTGINDTIKIALFYNQSFKVVDYLVRRYGMFKVKEMLQKFGEGKNSDEVVNEVLKVSVSRLEREWLMSLKK